LLIERIAYKPLRKTFYLAPLITSVGVSYSLEALALLIWGADVRSYNLHMDRSFSLLGARITEVQLIIIVVLVLSIALLAWLLKKTPLGIAIRAAADDFDMCFLVGVDGDQIIAAVFVIGSALAGIAGILLGMNTNLQTTIGLAVTIKAFAAIILGGLGNIYSCVLGGLIIGLAENLGIWYLPSVWKDAVAYVILFVILLIKPSGLLGANREAEVKL
jgi:branched-chain amino acid transport system permease protein